MGEGEGHKGSAGPLTEEKQLKSNQTGESSSRFQFQCRSLHFLSAQGVGGMHLGQALSSAFPVSPIQENIDSNSHQQNLT